MKKKINTTDLAYTAGYIDGDGCFYIGKERDGKRLKQKYVTSLVVTSVNTHVLYWFQNIFGGSVVLIKQEHDNKKSLYQFNAKKVNTLDISRQIFPYLVEKREECILLLRFTESDSADLKEVCIYQLRLLKDIGNLVSKYQKQEFERCKGTITPTEDDFAYLAGFIDAECSLNIQKYKPANKPNNVYKIILQCNNTKAPVFKWLIQRFGGQIHFIDRSNHGKARKNQLTWRLSGNALSKILGSIKPFLKHKKPVCEELIKFYETTLANGGARHTEGFRSLYAETLKVRESIVHKVHNLNLKGIKHLSG